MFCSNCININLGQILLSLYAGIILILLIPVDLIYCVLRCSYLDSTGSPTPDMPRA